MLKWSNFFAGVLVATLVTGCQKAAVVPAAPPPAATGTNFEYHLARGVVKEIDVFTRSAMIRHEAVPGYMGAMEMPFSVKNTDELRGLQSGDTITFRIVVAGNDAWIDQITNLHLVRVTDTNVLATVRAAPDLELGDPLPDYRFTNELGQPVSLRQFKGQALAFTFFFTSCPYPTFCPLMSNNFNETQKKLTALSNGPTNWHLISISLDTIKDSPDVLKAYAERYAYDPRRWDLVTGDLTDITALSDRLGVQFSREGGSISHRLRTVVVDARGRVQKIIQGNEWTSDELVAEMVKATAVKP